MNWEFVELQSKMISQAELDRDLLLFKFLASRIMYAGLDLSHIIQDVSSQNNAVNST